MKETTTNMDEATARRIAGDWHGGQASALYAFCSSGHFDRDNLVGEIRECQVEQEHLAAKGERGTLHDDNLAELAGLLAWVEEQPLTTDELVERARALGAEHGKAGGSRVEFGHPTGAMSAADCLRLDNDGDPMWWGVWGPASGPLSGEWADGMTPCGLVQELDYDPGDVDNAGVDALCDAYETAYYDAWRDEVLRMARYQVEGEK